MRMSRSVNVARLLALALLCAAAACTPPQPAVTSAPDALPADAPPGLVYAAQHCASCHAIRGDQLRSPHPGATPFRTIANTSGMTGYALTAWMRTSHPTMPNVVVESDRIEEVWDYMVTLKE